MKKGKLLFYRIPKDTDAWYDFRTIGLNEKHTKQYKCPTFAGGIGSSECATIIRQSPFDKERPTIMDYYHYKLGTMTPPFEPSELMISGLEDEERIKNRWQCYNGIDFLERYIQWKKAVPKDKSKFIIRKARRINAYIVNPEYPWLFYSPDNWAEKNSFSLIDNKILYKNGFPLEIKETSKLFVRNFKDEFPDSFNIQVQHGMLCTNSEYSEILMFVDRRFRVLPVLKDNLLCEEILEKTYKFWQVVLKGREFLKLANEARLKGDNEEYDRCHAEIASLEPMPDESEACTKFYKETYLKEVESVKAGVKYYNYGMKYNALNYLKNLVENRSNFYKNLLLQKAKSEGADKLVFEDLGYIKCFPKFYNGLKDEINKGKIEDEFNKININEL